MKQALALLLAAVLAGCVETAATDRDLGPSATSPGPTTTAPSPAFQTPNVTVSIGTDTTTTAETVTLWVNTTAPISVAAFLDGNESFDEEVAAAGEFVLPLEYGSNEIRVEVSAPGFQQKTEASIVRLGLSTLVLDFGVFHPASQGMPRSESFDVWFDVDSRPSASAYAEEGITNLDAFTAHDQLVVFELVSGKNVEFEYFPSFKGFGVSRIDGAGSAVSSDAPPWWCYTLNGESADGISIQPVVPGDVVAWELGSCA